METGRDGRNWPVWLLVAGTIGYGPGGAAAAPPNPAQRPNIVLIVADDLGFADLGFQGCKDIPTPHIDSIARQGIRCANGYVSCPVCSPTRAGLMTGRYQQRFGHEFNPGPRQDDRGEIGLPTDEITLPQLLQKAGYKTAMVGKWHLGYDEKYHPTRRGFDEFFGFLGGAHGYLDSGRAGQQSIFRGLEAIDEPAYLTDAFGREAVAAIERHQAEPFFLYLPFNAVHNPLQAPRERELRFSQIQDPKRRTYAAMLNAMDDAIGAVLGKLRDHGLEEKTLIYFISDNGGPLEGNGSNNAPLRQRKGTVYEGGVHVPFLVQWKGHLPAGSVYEQPVIALDLFATALGAASVPLPTDRPIDGVNLLPYLSGEEEQPPHSELYWRFGEQKAIRRGSMKLILAAQRPPELYDLETDISETTNLADKQPALVASLKKALAAWESETKPPRWSRQERRAGTQPRDAATKAARRERRKAREKDGN